MAPNYKRDIYDATPPEYHELVEAQEILDRQAGLLERTYNDVQDLFAQFFIETATWGLTNWERAFGVQTDVSKPFEERRAVLKARMRGVGTVTAEMIKNVAESWYGGEVNVIEKPAEYTVAVKFVSSVGVPPNLADVERELRALIPAHLALNFEFTYLLIREIDGVKTLAQMEQLTLDQFAGR